MSETENQSGRAESDEEAQAEAEAEAEAERRDRLDPENRPDNAEIDNTDREFDVERGMFTDSEGYADAEPRVPPEGEQGA